MKTKFLVVLAAAALGVSSLPLTAAAADTATLPDWIPTDYVKAVEFYNEHGRTYVQDGYICCVRLEARYASGIRTTENASALAQPIYEAEISNVLSVPDPSDEQAYAEFLELMDELRVPYFYGDTVALEQAYYEITVSVYHPETAGELSFDWVSYRESDNRETGRTSFAFDVAEDGTITETDVFGWMPDCVTEHRNFYNANGKYSVQHGYIVDCDRDNGSTAIGTTISMLGSGACEQVMQQYMSEKYLGELPTGGSSQYIRLYRPTRAGELQITDSRIIPWEDDQHIWESAVGYFRVADDLSVTQIKASDMKTPKIGDCDGDGAIGVSDVTLLHRYLAGSAELTDRNLADLDHDGVVDVFDLALLKRELLVQCPWEDGNIDFTQETQIVRDNTVENRKAFSIEVCQNWDSLKMHTHRYVDGEYVIDEPLQTITEDTFKDNVVYVVKTRSASSSQVTECASVERRGKTIIVHTQTIVPKHRHRICATAAC
ncbi:MAG: dockerin type I repeat-containing protein [Oscillospiraceae bacterium]|nr:dockerin type I repeat-containing protein [Oscillospiraceae bacterium]